MTTEVPACAERGVRNGQPPGIGRVACLGPLVVWNNLGRNFVFADAATLAPLHVFADTAFPGDDGASQYDLDAHAILRLDAERVAVLNHLGALRVFRGPPLEATLSCAVDAERAVMMDGRLVTSRTPPAGGIWVWDRPMSAPHSALDEWPAVTALDAARELLAVGAGRRVGLFRAEGARLDPLWDTAVAAGLAFLHVDAEVVWAAGPDRLLALRISDGSVAAARPLDDALAWGNGGTPLCVTAAAVCGLDRRGALHAFSRRDARPLGSTPPLGDRSLGIAHCAALGERVLAGFNRGGYRLFLYDAPP